MGVDITTYRCRIGCFSGISGSDILIVNVYINFIHGLKQVGSVIFIGILLLIAGIESNPGPTPGQPGFSGSLYGTELKTYVDKVHNYRRCCLGFKYLKDALANFCGDIAKKQLDDILQDIKLRKKLPTLTCGQCSTDTLRPDHVQDSSKRCPLGQAKCNCQHPRGKTSCRSKICGAIYDSIITLHTSFPPTPNWKNTDSRHWCTNPWEIAKCFINEDGYLLKETAFDTDCSGLLAIIINNKTFRAHTSWMDVFSKVLDARNAILYMAPHELGIYDANKYLGYILAVLKDVPELKTRKESKTALSRIEAVVSGKDSRAVADEINVLQDSYESIKTELFRIPKIIQVNLNSTDKLKAFKRIDLSRRVITQASQYLKDIWSNKGNIKLFVVKDSCFPRYEYAFENTIDIMKRYKTIFGLTHNGKSVSRYIAFYLCKGSNEIDFPCVINDIVSEYRDTETFKEKEFSCLSDCLRKRDKSMFSVFVVSGNMEELWLSDTHKEDLFLIFPRSRREARAISKRKSVCSREHVQIIWRENAREQVESYLEKRLFRDLKPFCEALFKDIEYTGLKKINEHTDTDVSLVKRIKSPMLPGSNKRKSMCSKFETTGNEEKLIKIDHGQSSPKKYFLRKQNVHLKRSKEMKTTKSSKKRSGKRDHKITTKPVVLNRRAEGRRMAEKSAEMFTTSQKGDGEESQHISNVLKVINKGVLHTVNEKIKECLLEELIGLYNMSNVSVQEMPNIQQRSHKVDLETLSKDLFAKCQTVTGVGFRMRKLQIAVSCIRDCDMEEKCTDICQILNQHNVEKYEIVPMSLKPYLTPGDEIFIPQNRQGGSFGCFAKMQDRENGGETPCGLLSKHVASTDQERSEILAKKDGQFTRRVGHILKETITEGGLDIAAATLSIPLRECETRFRSQRGRLQETGRRTFTESERLGGNKVHVWGAVSKPGKGIITVPDFFCRWMDHKVIQVEDIVDEEQKVVERFAQPGDSGAVTCVDDPGQGVVHPVSMIYGCMNYENVKADIGKTERGIYITVPLQSGLEQLRRRTGKNFDLY